MGIPSEIPQAIDSTHTRFKHVGYDFLHSLIIARRFSNEADPVMDIRVGLNTKGVGRVELSLFDRLYGYPQLVRTGCVVSTLNTIQVHRDFLKGPSFQKAGNQSGIPGASAADKTDIFKKTLNDLKMNFRRTNSIGLKYKSLYFFIVFHNQPADETGQLYLG